MIGHGVVVGPRLLHGSHPEARVHDDEIFEPVRGVTRVATYDNPVRLINADPYGNGVALVTRNRRATRRVTRDVMVAMTGVNVPIPAPITSYSFGGWTNSLVGHAPDLRTRRHRRRHPRDGRHEPTARALGRTSTSALPPRARHAMTAHSRLLSPRAPRHERVARHGTAGDR